MSRFSKELSQQFVFDLANSDLEYYYKHSIDGIEEAEKEAWRRYNNTDTRSTKGNKVGVSTACDGWNREVWCYSMVSAGNTILYSLRK
jgi:hypothetical protein